MHSLVVHMFAPPSSLDAPELLLPPRPESGNVIGGKENKPPLLALPPLLAPPLLDGDEADESSPAVASSPVPALASSPVVASSPGAQVAPQPPPFPPLLLYAELPPDPLPEPEPLGPWLEPPSALTKP